jgi:hypothetical protein
VIRHIMRSQRVGAFTYEWTHDHAREVGERTPDWELHIPDAFMVDLPLLTEDWSWLDCLRMMLATTHDRVIETRLASHDVTRLQGWYGDDRYASAQALRPLMEALTAWRDGRVVR